MAKQKGVKSLAETVNSDEIIISDEEVGTVNFMIDDTYAIQGSYGDYALVERKIKYRTGKEEDGINNGKVIQYIGWDTVQPHSYGRTPFDILKNYADYINLKKFKQLNKSSNFDDVKQIYLDTQNTIKQSLKSSQFTDDIKQQATLVNEIAELKSKLSEINKVFEEADELRELIKSKRKIIITDTEPKKHRIKKEE